MHRDNVSSVPSTGSLGKRTKFQQKEIAQLLLRVTIKEDSQVTPHSPSLETPSAHSTTVTASLSQDLMLGDDTLLDKIAFTDQPEQSRLSAPQQAAVLGEW